MASLHSHHDVIEYLAQHQCADGSWIDLQDVVELGVYLDIDHAGFSGPVWYTVLIVTCLQHFHATHSSARALVLAATRFLNGAGQQVNEMRDAAYVMYENARVEHEQYLSSLHADSP
jgi:hypothetical protein